MPPARRGTLATSPAVISPSPTAKSKGRQVGFAEPDHSPKGGTLGLTRHEVPPKPARCPAPTAAVSRLRANAARMGSAEFRRDLSGRKTYGGHGSGPDRGHQAAARMGSTQQQRDGGNREGGWGRKASGRRLEDVGLGPCGVKTLYSSADPTRRITAKARFFVNAVRSNKKRKTKGRAKALDTKELPRFADARRLQPRGTA